MGVNRSHQVERGRIMTTTRERLSPKVRRLLREHGLHARAVAGTGTAGRVTPHDVQAAAGVPHSTTAGAVLASPLARRLLRDAGLDPAEAARANHGRRLSGADAERIIGERSAATGAGGTPTPPSDVATTHVATTEVAADVGGLLAALAAADGGFLADSGFALGIEVAVASAAAAVLVRRPELASTATGPVAETGSTYPSVHVGLAAPQTQAPAVVVVPDAQYLTVAGLARRARAAVELAGSGEAGSAGRAAPTVVVATDAVAPDGHVTTEGLGLLTVAGPTPRRVDGVDAFGHEVVSTRPHTTLRLHHAAHISGDTAAAFLDEVATAVTTWRLPVGP